MAEFSDSQIREILIRHGEDIGPITPTTRNIYLQKIAKLQKTNGIQNKAELSDSEIKEILTRNGEVVGPITPSTRSIYLKKIASLQKTNGIPHNKTSKTRHSDSVLNLKPDKSYSRKMEDTNSSNSKGIMNNNNVPNNNIATQQKINYRSSSNYPQLNTMFTNYSKNNKTVEPSSSQNYSWDSSFDSGFQRIAEESHRKELQSQNVSPISYISTNERIQQRFKSGRPLPSTSSYSPGYKGQFEKNDNSSRKWYNGTYNAISNYFVSHRNQEDLMDISDGDLSDTEPGVINRLRKGYFKKSRYTPTMSTSNPVGSSSKTHNQNATSILAIISPSQLPNLLLVGFFAFAVLMIGSYLLLRAQHSSHRLLDQTIDRLICRPDSLDSTSHGSSPHFCFQAAKMPLLRTHLVGLFEVLSQHSGNIICQSRKSADQRVPFTRARELLNTRLRNEGSADISQAEWSDLIKLMLVLPRDELQLAGYNSEDRLVDETGLPEHVTYLEGLNPRQSLICRMKLFVLMIFSWVWYLVCVVAVLTLATVLAYAVNVLRLRHKQNYERHINELREIVSSISTLLQDQIRQSEYSPSTDPFIPLGKVRAMLQQTYPKLREPAYWEQFKSFMYKSEPLIELKETLVHGEIVQWKCRPGWQGSAVLSECQVKFERGPTECLKIRNMNVLKFDENSKNYLRREVMARIQDPSDVKDIRVLMKGSAVIVYVMCASREAAGKAFRQINANYFNGNLLNVKFIRIDKYVERFPDSRIYVK